MILLREGLSSAIDKVFPVSTVPGNDEVATIVMDELARSHRLLVDGTISDDLVNRICSHVSGGNQIFLLSGAPGRSTLLGA